MSHSTQHIKADLLLVGVTILASAGWIFSKEALTGLPPLLFIGIRFILAGALLAIIGRHHWQQLTWRGFKASIAVGSCFSIAIMAWITGLAHTEHIGEGAFITSLGIVLVPVISLVLYREAQPRSTWIALPVAIAGLFLLTMKEQSTRFHIEAGQGYFLFASVLFAIQFTLNNRVVSYVSALLLTAIQLLMVGIASTLASAAVEVWPSTVSYAVIGWLLASAIIATSIRFFIQTYAQSMAPASHGAMILTIEPILTACLAAYWFGESMSILQMLGCTLIFSALLINRWRIIKDITKSSFANKSR